MAIPASLNRNLALPAICAPMFIVSNPDLVIAQCKGGLIGSFPALNARPKELLDEWLTRIKAELAAEWVQRFDPALEARAIVARIDAANVARVPEGADLVLDGCDNFATRLAVSDACVAAGVPLTSAAIGRFQGQVANFAGHLPGQSCYRCFVGDAFDADGRLVSASARDKVQAVIDQVLWAAQRLHGEPG